MIPNGFLFEVAIRFGSYLIHGNMQWISEASLWSLFFTMCAINNFSYIPTNFGYTIKMIVETTVNA